MSIVYVDSLMTKARERWRPEVKSGHNVPAGVEIKGVRMSQEETARDARADDLVLLVPLEYRLLVFIKSGKTHALADGKHAVHACGSAASCRDRRMQEEVGFRRA